MKAVFVLRCSIRICNYWEMENPVNYGPISAWSKPTFPVLFPVTKITRFILSFHELELLISNTHPHLPPFPNHVRLKLRYAHTRQCQRISFNIQGRARSFRRDLTFKVFTYNTCDSTIITLERDIIIVNRRLSHQVYFQTHRLPRWSYHANFSRVKWTWWRLNHVIRLGRVLPWTIFWPILTLIWCVHFQGFWIRGRNTNLLVRMAAEEFTCLDLLLSLGWPEGNWLRQRVICLMSGWHGRRALVWGLGRDRTILTRS